MDTIKTSAILLLAVLVGVLLVILQIKGSALHRAQLDLLSRALEQRQKEDSLLVKAAKEAFARSLAEYVKHKPHE